MTDQQRSRSVIGPDYLLAGRYRLDSKLGGGGMGAVWLANDTLLSRKVAVKQATSTEGLPLDEAREIRERAMREGRMAAQLDNPHAIAMHDVAIDGGEPWLIMEYLPSRSLAMALHVTDTVAPYEVIQIGAQVADALAAAHAAGILHRDIKPGNILIADRGSGMGMVKISDFGISRAKTDRNEQDNSVITGTPEYFAPEVARGADPTEASDVFSLGATLYTATEGQPPFGLDNDSIALLRKVAQAHIIPPRRSAAMTATLLHMLEPDPARRPTMIEVRDRLIDLAVGKNGHPGSIINHPLTAADGTIPYWARRGARNGGRAERIYGQTMTGLPIAHSVTPLDRVPRPAASYSAPAFEVKPPRGQNKSNVTLYIGIGIATLIVVIVLLALLL